MAGRLRPTASATSFRLVPAKPRSANRPTARSRTSEARTSLRAPDLRPGCASSLGPLTAIVLTNVFFLREDVAMERFRLDRQHTFDVFPLDRKLLAGTAPGGAATL